MDLVEVSPPADRQWSRILAVVLRVALLVAAVVVLRRQLHGVRFDDLLADLRGYGLGHVGIALGITAASFVTLGLLELVALGYIGKRAKQIIPVKTALATGFIAHAYSQSVGLAILTGATVRGRSYSRFGLSATDIARMSVFVTVTATLGLITTGGFALLELHTRFATARLPISLGSLGVALLAGVAGYVAWALVGKSEFYGRGKWRVRRPTFGLTVKQICLSSLDWMLAGSVLFAVLPGQLPISYGVLLGIYLIAQTAAVVSHVPGGLGVFEAVVVALCNVETPNGVLPPSAATALAGSLFVYRIIYYVLPLFAALALSTVAELIRTRQPQRTTPGQIALSAKSTLPAADAI